MAVEFGLKLDSKTPVPELETTTANSTPEVDSTTEAIKGMSGGMSQEQVDSFNTPKSTETPEDALSNMEVGDVNVVDTDQLEANSSEFTTPKGSDSSSGLSFQSSLTSELDEITTKAGEIQGKLDTKVKDEKAEADLNKQRDDVFGAITNLGDMSGFVDDVEKETQLNKRREELTEITNKIRRKEFDFRRNIEGLQDQAGLTRAQKNAQIADIDRKQSREVADLEIIAMARQGRFNDAQAIVDRKVEIEFKSRQAELAGLQFLYSENKERFTLTEQREFEKNIKDEERQYQEDFAKSKELESLKLQMTINATEAGAGISELERIQGAGDRTQLMGLPNASKYLKSKAEKQAETLTSLNIALRSKELASIGQPSAADIKASEAEKQRNVDLVSDLKTKVGNIDDILDHEGKSRSVGTFFFNRWTPFKADASSKKVFAGRVQQLYAQETLSTLLELKAKGGTLGALSNEERLMLQNAATTLSTLEEKDENGAGTGVWKVSEADFDEEVNVLRDLTTIAIARAEGRTFSEAEIEAIERLYAEPTDDGDYSVYYPPN